MISLFAFNSKLASTTTGFQNVVPVADPIATVSGNLLYIGGLNNLLGAFVLNAQGTKAKLESPTLLNIAPHNVSPIVLNALPTATVPEVLQAASPRKLTTNEGLQAYSDATSGQADPQVTVGVILADGPVAPVAGEIIHARATVTTPSTANVWGNAAITFDTVLPAGSYDVVGARLEGSHLKLFRLVFQGNSSVRPGSLAALGHDGKDIPGSRDGGWGTWGTFDQFTPPSIDMMNDGTSETGVLYLDLIKK